MNLYYADGDRQVGPIGKAELQTLIKARKVNSQTLVWQPGMHTWEELGLFVRHKTQSSSQSVLSDTPIASIQQSVCSESPRSRHPRVSASGSSISLALAVQDRREGGVLQLRIGMAAGEPIQDDGDIHGTVVTQAEPNQRSRRCRRSDRL